MWPTCHPKPTRFDCRPRPCAAGSPPAPGLMRVYFPKAITPTPLILRLLRMNPYPRLEQDIEELSLPKGNPMRSFIFLSPHREKDGNRAYGQYRPHIACNWSM